MILDQGGQCCQRDQVDRADRCRQTELGEQSPEGSIWRSKNRKAGRGRKHSIGQAYTIDCCEQVAECSIGGNDIPYGWQGWPAGSGDRRRIFNVLITGSRDQ